ncbi:MAG TPA: peptidyl-prolyl cis-trans isomerase, partial [Gammaproteobacteria bacterium]|nr:peptidyl-prolyl cis-trans isomerase [Gammaproteobacteria bacterium]
SLYNRYLASAGYTPASFEAQVREDMTSEQLQAGIIETSFVTDASVEHIARLNNQTRDLRYLIISFDKVAEGIEVTDEEIKNWYDSHDKEYMEPEKVRLAYIDLSRDRIAKDVTVTEQDLKAYFENNRAKYNVEEQRKVRQILIKVGQNPAQEKLDKANAAAEKLLNRLKSGESFDQVANEVRENAGLNMEVSEFGYLSKGILEDSVDEVVFSLDEGAAGGPIRTQSGIHVVQVDDIKGGAQSTFAEVRDQVEADYRASQAEKQYFDYSERLATLAFEQPESLKIAAEDLDIPVQKSAFFSREGGNSDLLNDPKVISAAFSDEVLQNGNNSEIIELDTNHSLVLRVIDHKLPAKKPLQEVRDDAAAAIRFEKGSKETRRIGEQVIKELKQGQASETVAENRDLEWQSAIGVKRDDPKVNRSILRTAFSLGRPDDGPAMGGDALGSGDYAVVQVNAVHDAQTLAADDVRPERKELERLHASEAFNQFLDTLKSDAKIRILRNNL